MQRHINTVNITPKEFEQHVTSWLEQSSKKMANFRVTGLRHLKGPGGEYEIDAVAEFEVLGGAKIVVLVECKRYKSAVKRDVVMLLDAKLKETGAHKGIVFATAGFQRGALEYATAHGIATVHVVPGDTIFLTRGHGVSATPPSCVNVPQFAGWVMSITSEDREVHSLLSDERIEPLAEWLAS